MLGRLRGGVAIRTPPELRKPIAAAAAAAVASGFSGSHPAPAPRQASMGHRAPPRLAFPISRRMIAVEAFRPTGDSENPPQPPSGVESPAPVGNLELAHLDLGVDKGNCMPLFAEAVIPRLIWLAHCAAGANGGNSESSDSKSVGWLHDDGISSLPEEVEEEKQGLLSAGTQAPSLGDGGLLGGTCSSSCRVFSLLLKPWHVAGKEQERHANGRRPLLQSLAYIGTFIGIGLCVGVTGPALPWITSKIPPDTNLAPAFALRGIGGLAGSFGGAWALHCGVPGHFILAVAGLAAAAGVASLQVR